MRGSAWLVVLFAVAASAQETVTGNLSPEQKKEVMDKHYARAFELYAAGQYARAIEHWNQVLRLDPEQQAAKRLVAEARPRLDAANKGHVVRLKAAVAGGDYRGAFDALQQLLDMDPTNPERLALQERLRRVMVQVPSAEGAGRRLRVLRAGLEAWIAPEGKPDLPAAYDGLRYAAELAPDDAPTQALLAAFEREHPEQAAADPVAEGKLLESRRQAVLQQIYDGKYALAVKGCERILRLEPDDVVTLKRLGSAKYAMGRKREARSAWRRALELAPDDRQLQKYLGQKDQNE